MTKKRSGGSRQPELFPRSRQPVIPIEANHRLVRLADTLDWTELEVRAEVIRASKLKNAAGRPPKLRALLGAMILRATRKMSFRDAEDQIRHYAPARYLCGLSRDGLDARPQHAARLHGADGRRGRAAHQRVRGGVGGGGEAGGPEGGGGGYDSTGGGHPPPERDGAPGRLPWLQSRWRARRPVAR